MILAFKRRILIALYLMTGFSFMNYLSAQTIQLSDYFSKPSISILNEEVQYKDRFGNEYNWSELLLPGVSPNLPGGNTQAAPPPNCPCSNLGINTGIFELYFEDCELGTGFGFDDNSAATSAYNVNVTTLGQVRQEVACEAYAYLNNIFVQQSNPCSPILPKVNIRVMPSGAVSDYYGPGNDLNALASGVGGTAGPYVQPSNDGILDGLPWLVINTGSDPLPLPGYAPSIYHGLMRINFTNFISSFELDYQSSSTAFYDLYTIMLHEASHSVGFGTSIVEKNSGVWGSALSTDPTAGGFFRFDQFLKAQNGLTPVIVNSNINPYEWAINPSLNLPNDLEEGCESTANNNFVVFDDPNSVTSYYLYTPDVYNPASSLSHISESCQTNGPSYVMNPDLDLGEIKRTFQNDELATLCALGYELNPAVYGNCSAAVAGNNDFGPNCNTTYTVDACAGSQIIINESDLIANDINATGILHFETVGGGTLTDLGSGNYSFSAQTNVQGLYTLRYIPVDVDGRQGNVTNVYVMVNYCAGSCEFVDPVLAQSGNPSIIIDPNCGSPEIPCVNCGFNNNPCNKICNPEICSNNLGLIPNMSGTFANQSINFGYSNNAPLTPSIAITQHGYELPGWSVGTISPDYLSPGNPTFNVAQNPASGLIKMLINTGPTLSVRECSRTRVDLTPNQNYFVSISSAGTGENSNRYDEISVRMAIVDDATVQADLDPYSTNNSGTVVQNVPQQLILNQKFPTPLPRFSINSQVSLMRFADYFVSSANPDHLIIYGSLDLNMNPTSPFLNIHWVLADEVEVIEDNFSAGADYVITCGTGQQVQIGGEEFCTLSDVNVQYTWIDVNTGAVLLDYAFERELNGNVIINNILAGTTVTSVPSINVSPTSTTDYQITRTFLPDADGTLGGIDPSTLVNYNTTDQFTITVLNPLGNADFTHLANCSGLSVDFQSPQPNGVFSHSWDFGDNSNSTLENPTHVYSVAGSYNVVHTVTSACGVDTYSEIVSAGTSGLTLEKTVSNAYPTVATNVTYTIEVCNTSSLPISNILVQDVLPEGIEVSAPSIGGFTYDLPSRTLSQVINLPAAGSAPSCTTLSFVAAVKGTSCAILNCATAQDAAMSCPLTEGCVPIYVGAAANANNIILDNTSIDVAISSGQLPAGTLTGYSIYVDGLLTIDQPYEFINCHFYMSPGSEIIVPALSGNSLGLRSSVVEGCSELWKGISIEGNAKLGNNTIKDAEYGVKAGANSTIRLRGNTFENNYVGLYVAPSVGGQIQMPNVFMTGNQFIGGNLLPHFNIPTFVNQSKSGIELHNVGGFTVGAQPHAFSNLATGIEAYQTSILIANANFSNIQQQPSYTSDANGAAIFVQGSGSELLIQTGNGNTSPNFTNCYKGVYARQLLSTQANDNFINGCHTAIDVEDCATGGISIQNNKIENALFFGIDLNRNAPNFSMQVRNNDISMQAGTPSIYGAGIRITEVAAQTVSTVGSPVVSISDNTIDMDGGVIGIFLNGAEDYESITNNSIQLHNLSHPTIGIVTNGGQGNRLRYNNITGAGPNDSNAGIWGGMSGFNTIECNVTDNLARGMEFHGICSNTDLRGNLMQNHDYGLWLGGSAVLSTQSHKGNQFANCNVEAEPTSANPSLSRFFVNGIALPYWPVNSPNVSGWFLNDPFGTTFNCGPLPPAYLITPGSEDEAIANFNINTLLYEEELEWSAAKQLYQKLRLQNGLTGNAVLDNFYTNSTSGTIGDLHQIKETGKTMYNQPDLTPTSDLKTSESKVTAINLLDDQLDGTSDPNLEDMLMQSRQTALIELQMRVNALKTTEVSHNTQQEIVAENVRNENNTIVINKIYEGYEQTVNEIYLSTIAKGVFSFSQVQENELALIAGLCPLSGGNAVFKARSLYERISGITYYDDVAICQAAAITYLVRPDRENISEEVNRKAEQAEREIISSFVEIAPNPSFGKSVVEWQFEAVSEQAQLTVFDSYGRIVYEMAVNENKGNVEIDLTSLPKGLYWVKIINGVDQYTKKIVSL